MTDGPKRLQPLADSSFGKGGSVDLLLGSKALSEASVEQISKHPTGTFTALNTIFGCVVFGGTTSPTKRYEPASTIKITTKKEHYPTLGASRPTALKRLLSTERFLQRRGIAMLRKSLHRTWRSRVSNSTTSLCMWSSRLPLLPPKPDQSLTPLPRPPQGGH